MEFDTETMFDLPLLYRLAKEIDEKKAGDIGRNYLKLEIRFDEACDQFREVIENGGGN